MPIDTEVCMFCKNCGNKLAEDALFCNNCGARQDQADPAQPGPYSPPAAPLPPTQQGPGAYYQASGRYTPPSNPTGAPSGQNGQYAPPPGPYAPPPKNNTTKILIISLAGLCVVIAAVLILVLKPFSSNGENATASTSDAPVIGVEDDLNVVEPDNDTSVFDDSDGLNDTEDSFNSYDFGSAGDNAAGNSAAPSAPTGTLTPSAAPGSSSTQELTMFNVPAWSQDPIYTVIDPGGVWTSVGLATNPNQVSGSDGVFTLADYEGCVYYAEFFADLTWKIKFDEAGDIGVGTAYYEIMDLNYADIYEYDDSYGFRFYNGSDGRLYMCFYLIDDDLYPDASDFVVFEKKGDTVDWAAE